MSLTPEQEERLRALHRKNHLALILLLPEVVADEYPELLQALSKQPLPHRMYIELMWIDSMIGSWLRASSGGLVTPSFPPCQVQAALEIVHKNAPSSITRYRKQFPNFDELFRFANMMPPDATSPSGPSHCDRADVNRTTGVRRGLVCG